MKNLKRFNETESFNKKPEDLDARKIVLNILESYNLANVESKKYQADLANMIINDLVHAGFMK